MELIGFIIITIIALALVLFDNAGQRRGDD